MPNDVKVASALKLRGQTLSGIKPKPDCAVLGGYIVIPLLFISIHLFLFLFFQSQLHTLVLLAILRQDFPPGTFCRALIHDFGNTKKSCYVVGNIY